MELPKLPTNPGPSISQTPSSPQRGQIPSSPCRIRHRQALDSFMTLAFTMASYSSLLSYIAPPSAAVATGESTSFPLACPSPPLLFMRQEKGRERLRDGKLGAGWKYGI